MNLEQIYGIVVAAAPALTSIIGIVFAVVKGIKNNKTTSTDLINKFEEVRKDNSELKSQLRLSYQENYELKKKLNEFLTKMDHIQRKEDE